MLFAAAAFMAVFGLIYFFWKESGGRKPLIFKALATFMPVLLALYYAYHAKEGYAWWIFAGTICYMAADVLLEIWFLTGVAFFGAGHICITAGLVKQGVAFRYMAICFLLLIGMMFLVLGKYMKKLGSLLVPGLLYAALLCLMAATAVSSGIQAHNISGILLGTGGIFFVVSDTILGWSHLSGKRKQRYSAILLILYYLAVYLLVTGNGS